MKDTQMQTSNKEDMREYMPHWMTSASYASSQFFNSEKKAYAYGLGRLSRACMLRKEEEEHWPNSDKPRLFFNVATGQWDINRTAIRLTKKRG